MPTAGTLCSLLRIVVKVCWRLYDLSFWGLDLIERRLVFDHPRTLGLLRALDQEPALRTQDPSNAKHETLNPQA